MEERTIHIKTEIDPKIQAIFDGKASPGLLRRLFERVDELPNLISVYTEHRPASGAGDLWVVLKPTEALLELMAAFTT